MAKRNLPPDQAEAAAKAHTAATKAARGRSMVTRPEGKTFIWFDRASYGAGKEPDLHYEKELTDAEVFALLVAKRREVNHA